MSAVPKRRSSDYYNMNCHLLAVDAAAYEPGEQPEQSSCLCLKHQNTYLSSLKSHNNITHFSTPSPGTPPRSGMTQGEPNTGRSFAQYASRVVALTG
jgi:hypothetical protein